ncbi:MAG: hypothetical protein AAF318_05135 [Pseudomonadota bacterium]
MRWPALLTLVALGACQTAPDTADRWFADADRIAPTTTKAWVCHGFGCHYRNTVTLSRGDRARMRRIVGRPKSAAAERRRIAKLISWMERRVATTVGSAGDVGGLDLQNARVRGQMDCIDEATNTSSYLMIAQAAGLLRFHTVAGPVSRGFLIDGRYPHATAVIRGKDGDFAVDSWPEANGVPPKIVPVSVWFAERPGETQKPAR